MSDPTTLTPETAAEPLVVTRLANALQDQQALLATAESCTGGLLSVWCTDQPGSSGWFHGGVISYSNHLKEQLLGVPAELLASEGAVSESCAAAMARGAAKRLGADLAISTTGVAGPAGGSAAKPVGMVCFGWYWHNEVHTLTRYFQGQRRDIRQEAATFALAEAVRRVEFAK